MPRCASQFSGPSPCICWPLKSSSVVSWLPSTTLCWAIRFFVASQWAPIASSQPISSLPRQAVGRDGLAPVLARPGDTGPRLLAQPLGQQHRAPVQPCIAQFQRLKLFLCPVHLALPLAIASLSWDLCTTRCVESGQVDSHHLAVQKQQGAERLVVGGGRNLPLIDQHVEECFDLRRAHVARATNHPTAAMPADKKAHPIRVSFFGLQAIVIGTGCATEPDPEDGWSAKRVCRVSWLLYTCL
jgi:hypothetical protein